MSMSFGAKSNGPPKLAVLGGGGFAGTRLVQLNEAIGKFEVIPILRSYRGLARLGRALAKARVVETTKIEVLNKALTGCQTVVNMTMGDELRARADIELLHAACVQAVVRQLIHISSAVVFGRVTDPTVHDDSPPDTGSWMLYARGKAQAEVWLRSQIGKSPFQIIILRPGLIWGPGSNWSDMVGDQLQHGSAVLSNQGAGIANLIFVDNLAKIIMAVASRIESPSGFYNVADLETVTWRQYYTELSQRLGYPEESVTLWPDNRLRLRAKHVIEWAVQQPLIYANSKAILKRLGPDIKEALKAKLKGTPQPPGPKRASGPPILSRASWALQNTLNRLSTKKIHQDFGPLDLVPFPQALDMTAASLKFGGFAARGAEVVATNTVAGL